MLRPPSIQKQYDDFYPYDPAFDQLADNASDEQQAEYRARWESATDTGDYSKLGNVADATKFVMRPVPGKSVLKIDDLYSSRRIGENERWELALRCALVDIANAPVRINIKPAFHEDPSLYALGHIAPVEVINQLHEIDPRIVPIMGARVWSRAVTISPKP